MKATYCGTLEIDLPTGKIELPIGLFKAVDERTGNYLHQYCPNCATEGKHSAVGRKNVCKVCNTEVANADILKGMEIDKGVVKLIPKEALEQLDVKQDGVITFDGFVSDVDTRQIEATYYLSLYKDKKAKGGNEISREEIAKFNLLLRSMELTGLYLVGRLVMSESTRAIAIKPTNDSYFEAYTLNYPANIRSTIELPVYPMGVPSDVVKKFAEVLKVSKTANPKDSELYKDNKKALLLDIVEGKPLDLIVREYKPATQEKSVEDIFATLTGEIKAQ